MLDSRGNPTQSIQLQDPERIKSILQERQDIDDEALTREIVIPLLLDIRTLVTAVLQSLGALQQIGMNGLHILDSIRQNGEVAIAPKFKI